MDRKFLDQINLAFGLPPGSTIDPNTRLADLPQWDSLSILTVITLVELEYDLLLSAENFRKLKTVGDLFELWRKN